MTFFDFLDKQIDRFTVTTVAGSGIFLLTLIVLAMLYKDRTLADNQLFSVLAQAIVVQGLIGLAMASWFTRRDEPPAPADAAKAAQHVADEAQGAAHEVKEPQ